MLNQLQYHRRTFRGRGGPTDRRLPKHNAARRRPTLESNDESAAELASVDEKLEDDNSSHLNSDLAVAFIREGESALQIIDPVVDIHEDNEKDSSHVYEAEEIESTPEKKEIDHLNRRIRNNRTSMSLSATALANPASYQSNVLAACLNTIKEWRSILRHHSLDEVSKKSVGLAIFELMQQSLQCGPLAGAKPGYFKRCGSEVAAMVYKYLEDAVLDVDDAVDTLCFTKTQADAIESWKGGAQKAAASSKPPSKSVLKSREKAKKKK